MRLRAAYLSDRGLALGKVLVQHDRHGPHLLTHGKHLRQFELGDLELCNGLAELLSFNRVSKRGLISACSY